MKTADHACGRCAFWKPIDAREFMGICGHREHDGEMTDRHEGENCDDFEREEKPDWLE